jgi:hypothetical protein
MIEASQLLITFLINAMWQIPLVAAIAALCARLVRHAPSGLPPLRIGRGPWAVSWASSCKPSGFHRCWW